MRQRSEEWHKARLGIVTASRVADVMSEIKTGVSASYKNYQMELLCERLTGSKENGFVSEAMQRGIDKEVLAKAAYEVKYGVFIEEVGFIKHREISMGASPDGLVNDGLIEIKCPNTANHINFIRTGNIPEKYVWQMLCQMECTGRGWCDFVSFDDRLPERLQLFKKRVTRDCELVAKMLNKVIIFNKELDELIASLELA